jgi:hypothetical protein
MPPMSWLHFVVKIVLFLLQYILLLPILLEKTPLRFYLIIKQILYSHATDINEQSKINFLIVNLVPD